VTVEPVSTEGRMIELRRAFDSAFAVVPPRGRPNVENLLAVRVGPSPAALRLGQVAGLFVDKSITRLPGSVPALLGIAGYRGALIPVYDLCALLGDPESEPPRWSVVVAGDIPLALAFHQFDGHLRVPREAADAVGDPDLATRLSADLVRADGVTRPIIDVPLVLDLIRTRTHQLDR
jgi:chemotaxis signal transduction protein